MLTFIGFSGSLIILLSFILAAFVNRYYFLLGIAGFVINWFGDSLDGRLAYFRNKPRKWYGFSVDLLIDWQSTVLIGLGYIIYADGWWEMAGFGFVTMYGWAMLIAVIRYKVTGKYTIDSGLFGPTEVRIMIATIMVAEIFFKGALLYFAASCFRHFTSCQCFRYLQIAPFCPREMRQKRKNLNDLPVKIVPDRNSIDCRRINYIIIYFS